MADRVHWEALSSDAFTSPLSPLAGAPVASSWKAWSRPGAQRSPHAQPRPSAESPHPARCPPWPRSHRRRPAGDRGHSIFTGGPPLPGRGEENREPPPGPHRPPGQQEHSLHAQLRACGPKTLGVRKPYRHQVQSPPCVPGAFGWLTKDGLMGVCRKDAEKENQTMLHVMKRKRHCRRLPKLSAFQILPLASSLLLRPVHLLWPSCPSPRSCLDVSAGTHRPARTSSAAPRSCPPVPPPTSAPPPGTPCFRELALPLCPLHPHRPRHTGPADLVTDGACPATVPHPLSPSSNPGTESRPSLGTSRRPALRNAFCISSVPRRHCESASGAIRPPSQARC